MSQLPDRPEKKPYVAFVDRYVIHVIHLLRKIVPEPQRYILHISISSASINCCVVVVGVVVLLFYVHG